MSRIEEDDLFDLPDRKPALRSGLRRKLIRSYMGLAAVGLALMVVILAHELLLARIHISEPTRPY